MVDTIATIMAFIEKNRMISPGDHVVAGISGGADSVCLFLVLKELRKKMDFSITAVHVNHCIRGEEADQDEEFVKCLCNRENVAYRAYRIQVECMAKEQKLSVEEAGRKARYEIFHSLASAGNSKIAVAHHMDDQSETVLMNLFRGSAIKGICGMQPQNGKIIRPLLCVRRRQIEEIVAAFGQEYRIDSTNQSNDYLRNKIRNIVVPYLVENMNEHAVENICHMSEMVSEAENYVAKQAKQAYQKCVRKQYKDSNMSETTLHEYKCGIKDQKSDAVYIIDMLKFADLDTIIKKYVVRDVIAQLAGRLKDVYKVHIESVIALEKMQVGSRVDIAYGISAYREYSTIRLYIRELQQEDRNEEKNKSLDIDLKCDNERELLHKYSLNRNIYISQNTTFFAHEVIIRQNKLSEEQKMQLESKKIQSNDYTKSFDYDKIDSTLQIRTRQSGDYIVVDEKGSKKKLKDYFINEKVPREERDSVLLVADGSHIVWIVGFRMSSAYKLTRETKRAVTIAFY